MSMSVLRLSTASHRSFLLPVLQPGIIGCRSHYRIEDGACYPVAQWLDDLDISGLTDYSQLAYACQPCDDIVATSLLLD